MTIRRATIADKDDIAALVIRNHLQLSVDSPQEYIRQTMDVPVDFEHIVNPSKFAQSTYIVALDPREKIVASAGTIPSNVKKDERAIPDHSDLELTGVSVSASYRRMGLARTLCKRAIEAARNNASISTDISRRSLVIHLVTLKERMGAACHLYEALGFVLVREVPVYDDPMMTLRYYQLDLSIV